MDLSWEQFAVPAEFAHSMKSPAQYSSVGEQLLAHAQAGREVIQDFVPLADSLEWELGQESFRWRGNKAFISDTSPVPYVINNDGSLSRNAAEVFFTSLAEAEKAEPLEEEIFVLELGIGVGLFARFFLDHFKELCHKNKKDFYDRLFYVAGDRSERMLLDALRHGVFGSHLGRIGVHYVDALKPEETLAKNARFHGQDHKPFRAVFLNYLLDCLPASVVEIDGDNVKELCVRTCLARNVRLSEFTDLTIEQLRERAVSDDPRFRQELLEVYGLFASEYDYQSTALKKIPYGEFAHSYCEGRARRLLINFGAIQCLSRLMELIHGRGFIL